jgi:hypothetical protein
MLGAVFCRGAGLAGNRKNDGPKSGNNAVLRAELPCPAHQTPSRGDSNIAQGAGADRGGTGRHCGGGRGWAGGAGRADERRAGRRPLVCWPQPRHACCSCYRPCTTQPRRPSPAPGQISMNTRAQPLLHSDRADAATGCRGQPLGAHRAGWKAVSLYAPWCSAATTSTRSCCPGLRTVFAGHFSNARLRGVARVNRSKHDDLGEGSTAPTHPCTHT